MPHAVDEHQLGSRDGRRGRAATTDVHHLVGRPWMTRVGMRSVRSRTVRLGWVRIASICRITPLADTPRSKVSSARRRAGSRRRRGSRGSRSPSTSRRSAARRPRGPACGGATSIGSSDGLCHPTVRRPVVDMMLVIDSTRAGARDGHRLDDHAAHRDPGDVRRLRCRGGRAGRGRRRPCRRGSTAPAPARWEGADQLGARTRCADPRRATGVAVVVADDEEAGPGQSLAEVGVPPGHRAAQAHHQQQRVVVGGAEGLVAELDAGAHRGEDSSET